MKLELLTSEPKGKSKGNLLFVHGICVGAWVWQEHFASFFNKAGYTTHALSLRGHGKSEGRKELPRATLADYTDDLTRIVGTIENPILVGHSLGGAVVQNYLRLGGNARGVALLASVPPWGLALAAARMAITRPRLFSELSRMQTFGLSATSPEVMHEALFSPSVSMETFHKFEPLFTDESRLIGAELQGFRPLAPMPWQSLPPVFVLGGATDHFIPADEVIRTATYYRTQAAIIPALAHAIMLDTNWQDAATPLLEWLTNLA